MSAIYKDDLAIVQKVLAGDNEAFAAIIERYQDKIFRYVYFKISDYDEALDITQDIFVIAFESLKTFRGEAKFSTWLYSIAINHCRNFYRKKAKIKEQSLSQSVNILGESFDLQLEDERENVELKYLTKDALAILQEEISSLPADYREVVVLRDIEGLTYNEISEALNLKLSNVKVRIYRGREILRKRLNERGVL